MQETWIFCYDLNNIFPRRKEMEVDLMEYGYQHGNKMSNGRRWSRHYGEERMEMVLCLISGGGAVWGFTH